MISDKVKKSIANDYFKKGEKFKAAGKYKKALESFKLAYNINKKISTINITNDIMEIADCYKEIGNFKMADKAFSEAERAFTSIGKDKDGLATCLIGHANLYRDRGFYPDAEQLYQRALRIQKKLLGTDHHDIATTLDDIAALKTEMFQYEDAERLYKKALKIRKKTLGADHELIAKTLNSIASLKFDAFEYVEAERLYKKTLNIAKKALGPDDELVARALNGIALVKFSTEQYDEAERLYKEARIIAKKALGPDDLNVGGIVLDNLAFLKLDRKQYIDAEPLYKEVLRIKKKALGPNDSDLADTINYLGLFKYYKGKYDVAEALYKKALRIAKKESSPDDQLLVGMILNNIAALKLETGKRDAAASLYNKALSIAKKEAFGLGDFIVARALNGIALLRYYKGQYDTAEPLYKKALRIAKKVALGPNDQFVGLILNNFGLLKAQISQYDEADRLFKKALRIAQNALGQDDKLEALVINNLGFLQYLLGQHEKAEEKYKDALRIAKNKLGPNHYLVAMTHSNLALLKSEAEEYDEAERLYKKALRIAKKALGAYNPFVAKVLNNIAGLKLDKKQYEKAEPLFQKALGIVKKELGPYHHDVAMILSNIASLKVEKGQYDRKEILLLYQNALQICHHSQVPEQLWVTLYGLAKFFSKENKNGTAIFFGKQAVNIIQSIRGNVHRMGEEIASLYTDTVEDVFRYLADLLIGEGGFLEAEQILNLLKEHEYFEYIRRDAANKSDLMDKIYFTDLEIHADTLLSKQLKILFEIIKRKEIFMKKVFKSKNEEKQLKILEEKIKKANKKYHRIIETISREIEKIDRKKNPDQIKIKNSITAHFNELGDNTVAIYMVASEKKFRTMLMVPSSSKTYDFSHNIGEKELRKKIFQFRRVLLMGHGEYDPIDMAQELYDIIIGRTMADKLRECGAQTLIWHLDGKLRYIPIAALHDGEKYLVETYQNIMVTPLTMTRMKDTHRQYWEGFGLGVTKKHKDFQPLPYVKEELASIIRSDDSPNGIMNGTICIDNAFTFDNFRNGVRNYGYPVVHIASHFQCCPWNEKEAYLLLGDGNHLNLNEIRKQNNFFSGVELLTLSACNTAVGDDRRAGREVECFGLTAENQGAKAILASLWSVEDKSTSFLMQEFYRQHALGNSKAESLRQAQIAFITGKIKPTHPHLVRNKRSSESNQDVDEYPDYRYDPDPQKLFAHPYYWAPFILIGNWK